MPQSRNQPRPTTRTITAPRPSRGLFQRPGRSARAIPPELLGRDPNGIYPAHRTELQPILIASLVLGFLAFLVCAKNGWLLLYGDAVAHLGIARRILDARYPGLAQLGGVWLPLPHFLMLPFVQRMDWWQTGVAGSIPSLAAYIAGNLGCYRLARRLMPVNWAFVATAFIALNPNLLYLSTTAMTEPLFLALLLWSTVITLEAIESLRLNQLHIARVRMLVSAALTLAMVLTRYDGWIIGFAAWLVLAIAWYRSTPETRKATTTAFAISTLITVAGPLLWFAYNARYQGDWLDFLRGPYSASAIEKKTSPPSAGRYHGWHNPLYGFLYFTRAAQLDAAAWETGFALFAASLFGTWLLWKQRLHRTALLLWVPLPFYMYSMAYSSVPIFIPQLYPNAWYNSRYGMELLPAFAIFGTLAIVAMQNWLRERSRRGTRNRDQQAAPSQSRATGNEQRRMNSKRLVESLLPASLLLIVLNTFVMFGTVGTLFQAISHRPPWTWVGRPPLVFDEAVVNSRTRIPFERALAAELLRAPQDATIMIDTTDHIGAVQDAGISLKRLISPLDSQRFDEARAAPALHANLVIALDHDPVAAAVQVHPQGLSEIEILCHTGQPCARIYRSDAFGQSELPKGTHPMIPFVKAHACGNDFLILDAALAHTAEGASQNAGLARHLCNRNTSIGADGIEFLERQTDGTLSLRLFNADGSEAELSGNGTRCVAAWLAYSEGLRDVTLHTPKGPRACTVIECDDASAEEHFLIRTGMGIPRVREHTLHLSGIGPVAGAIVEVGNPHFVLFTGDPDFRTHGVDWQDLGARLCFHPDFPNQTNVEFVRLLSPTQIEFRIFERGVGPTTSSGTGTCSSAAAAITLRNCSRQLTAASIGGPQQIDWPTNSTPMLLTGPAEIICTGHVSIAV